MVDKKSKEFKDIIKEDIIDYIDEEDITRYINKLKDEVNLKAYPSKLKIFFKCEFTTPMAFDKVDAYYSHPAETIKSNNNLNSFYVNLNDRFRAWVDGFQEKGSGFVFSRILSTDAKQYKVSYLRASSYIPLQFKSSNIINVKNTKDNKCFTWAILSKLFPANDNKERVSKYKPYEDKLNMEGIEYPVCIKDIPKVEKLNSLSINVFALKDPKGKTTLYPVFVSDFKSDIVIDLLYLEDNTNTHYCLIKDLDSFLCVNKHKMFTCRNCLQGFRRKETLESHKKICENHKHCKTIMPKEGKNILEFKNYHYKEKLPFTIYCDFEANNIPLKSSQSNPNKSYTKKIFKQKVNSYGIYVKSLYPRIFKSEYFSYIGKDAKEKFIKEIVNIYKKITFETNKRKDNKPMLSKQQEEEFQEATTCYICEKEFEELESCPKCKENFLDEDLYCYNCEKQYEGEHKIREHNHFTGHYRGPACLSCNSKEGKDSKIIPVFFHNGSNYDFHFIIEELMKYEDDYNKVTLLSKTSEEYISIEYGSRYQKLRFLDSYRFLQKGLAAVAKSLTAFPILEEEFKDVKINTKALEKSKKYYISNDDNKEYQEKVDKYFLLKQKGYYPYEYINSFKRFKETELPSDKREIFNPKNKKTNIPNNHKLYKYCHKWNNYRKVSKWFSTLTQSDITKEQFNHAQNVWKTYKCFTFEDYHNLYLKTDVLILADAFEQFRDFFLKHHQIDPCYCFSAPGLTWECGLKYTKVKLDLLTDYDMLLMFEKGIRGGFSGVLGPRHVKAFNNYTPNYDDGNRIIDDREMKQCLEILKNGGNLNEFLEQKYLLYLDANNLYGWAMSQKLPTKDFKWENNPYYYKKIPKGRGCIIECDLEYTDECKEKTFKYPLAPEHFETTKDMLSDWQKNVLEKQETKLGKEKKLLLTLYDKKKYVVHHSILKYYESLGMKVTKVHRTISFEDSAWLKCYIDFNTNQRKNAKTEFEKDLWKLMNNAFYGKTMENIRNRCEINLSGDPKEVEKFINKANFKSSVIFNDNLVAIVNNVTSIKFNKPIYLGQVILDYSKLLMYKFYYEVVEEIWKNNELVASDTDSIFLSIKTKDIYEDMKSIINELDTSGYPEDHHLYSKDNKKVIGKFKDELNGKVMSEIVFLRSKAYSYTQTNNVENKKLKGISSSIVKNDIKFDHYKNCLYNTEIQLNKMYRLNSDKHNMYVNEVNKVSLNPFDDKRYICDDGITTLPFGF